MTGRGQMFSAMHSPVRDSSRARITAPSAGLLALPILLILVLLIAWPFCLQGEGHSRSAVPPDGGSVDRPARAGNPAAAPGDMSADLARPADYGRRLEPGTRAAMRVPRVARGIPLGDGSFLPPLNGVRVEDGIPPIRRDRRLPPPGPVVAKQADLSGQEWWIHADGSQTSCSYASVTVEGEARTIVATQHGAAVPGRGALSSVR